MIGERDHYGNLDHHWPLPFQTLVIHNLVCKKGFIVFHYNFNQSPSYYTKPQCYFRKFNSGWYHIYSQVKLQVANISHVIKKSFNVHFQGPSHVYIIVNIGQLYKCTFLCIIFVHMRCITFQPSDQDHAHMIQSTNTNCTFVLVHINCTLHT